MAWIIILIAANIINKNYNLNYKNQLIKNINRRKIKKLEYQKKQNDLIFKKIISNQINLNHKYKLVLGNYKKNKNTKDIAKKLKLGVRETQLIIKLYYHKGGEIG